MRKEILFLSLIAIHFVGSSQNLSVEMLGGSKAVNILTQVNHPFKGNSKWGIMGVVNSNMPYDTDIKIYNYHFINTAIYYKLGVKSKIKTSVFLGGFKNPKRYGPLLGLRALLPFKNGKLSLSNQHQFSNLYTTNIVGVFEYKPKINDKVQLYSRLQVMYETDFQITTRSYQMLRLGLVHKKIQFGLAGTFDQFKNQTILFENYGLFIKTTL